MRPNNENFTHKEEPSSLEVCLSSLDYQANIDLDTGQKRSIDLDIGQKRSLDLDTGQKSTLDCREYTSKFAYTNEIQQKQLINNPAITVSQTFQKQTEKLSVHREKLGAFRGEKRGASGVGKFSACRGDSSGSKEDSISAYTVRKLGEFREKKISLFKEEVDTSKRNKRYSSREDFNEMKWKLGVSGKKLRASEKRVRGSGYTSPNKDDKPTNKVTKSKTIKEVHNVSIAQRGLNSEGLMKWQDGNKPRCSERCGNVLSPEVKKQGDDNIVRRGCKMERILGERQDKRIAKEAGKLWLFENGQNSLEGRIGDLPDKEKMKETAESEKIASELWGKDCKVGNHGDENEIIALPEGLTPLKEFLRQPAENDDTSSISLETNIVDGGEQNSLMNASEKGDEQNSHTENEEEWSNELSVFDNRKSEELLQDIENTGKEVKLHFSDLQVMLQRISESAHRPKDFQNYLQKSRVKILEVVMTRIHHGINWKQAPALSRGESIGAFPHVMEESMKALVPKAEKSIILTQECKITPEEQSLITGFQEEPIRVHIREKNSPATVFQRRHNEVSMLEKVDEAEKVEETPGLEESEKELRCDEVGQSVPEKESEKEGDLVPEKALESDKVWESVSGEGIGILIRKHVAEKESDGGPPTLYSLNDTLKVSPGIGFQRTLTSKKRSPKKLAYFEILLPFPKRKISLRVYPSKTKSFRTPFSFAPKKDSYRAPATKKDSHREPTPKSDSHGVPVPKSDSHRAPAPKSDSHRTPTQKKESHRTPAPKKDSHREPAPKKDSHRAPAPKKDSHRAPAPKKDTQRAPALKKDSHRTPALQKRSHRAPTQNKDSHIGPAPKKGSHRTPAPKKDSHRTPVPKERSHRTPAQKKGPHRTLAPKKDSYRTLAPKKDSHRTPVPKKDSHRMPFPKKDPHGMFDLKKNSHRAPALKKDSHRAPASKKEFYRAHASQKETQRDSLRAPAPKKYSFKAAASKKSFHKMPASESYSQRAAPSGQDFLKSRVPRVDSLSAPPHYYRDSRRGQSCNTKTAVQKFSHCSKDQDLRKSVVQMSSKGDNSCDMNPTDSGTGRAGNKNQKNDDYDNGASEKESRNQDDEKDTDEKENVQSGRTAFEDKSEHDSPTSNATFKFRRKQVHGKLGNEDLTDFLGVLQTLDQDIPPDLLPDVQNTFSEINNCLRLRLRKQTTEIEEDSCITCLCLDSLIQHFGKCPADFKSDLMVVCQTCLKLFRIVQFHVQNCVMQEEECPIFVCQKISYLVELDKEMIYTKADKIWRKLKKFLQSYVDVLTDTMETEEETFFSMTPLTSTMIGINSPLNPTTKRPLRVSMSFSPNLPYIPEDNKDLSLSARKVEKPPLAKQFSSSEPICRRKPDGSVEFLKGPKSAGTSRPNHLPFQDILDGKPFPGNRLVSPSGGIRKVKGPPDSFPLFSPTGPSRVPEKRPLKVSFSNEIPKRNTSLREPVLRDVDIDAFPDHTISTNQPTEHEDTGPVQPTSMSDMSESSSLGTEKTYGHGDHIRSMPMTDNPWRNGHPLLSLKERPTGCPGIGEVVYGKRDIIQIVGRYWTELKKQYKEYGGLFPKQVREEGVIFPDCKKKLIVMRSRYQKNFQWIRLTHLGRGMSGNCHMASDYTTEYKFCIKKIHISKYEEEELLIWSDLEHPSIVRLHGALRRNEKIYIISEFIGGGSLTETINEQKRMTRRLSHWTAINYFKQILEVLKYLQKKNVLHEDLKGDNILLRTDSHKIAVADFGVAVRIHGNTTLPGSTNKGTPTQFSPEKAMSAGHNYKSDLWSAVCILVHMLSGDPPWVKRFPNAKMLNFLIVEKDPPVEDVPKNVSLDVLSLIREGFQKDPKLRPDVEELLQHRAFGILDSKPDTFTSTLLTSIHQLPDTQLPIENRIQQEQQSVVQQIEESIHKPPPPQMAPQKLFSLQQDDLSVVYAKNVDVRSHDHCAISPGVIPDTGQMVSLHKSEVSLRKSLMPEPTEFGGAASMYLRSIEETRINSIQKALAAPISKFLPDKSQENVFFQNYMNDNIQTEELLMMEPETSLTVYTVQNQDTAPFSGNPLTVDDEGREESGLPNLSCLLNLEDSDENASHMIERYHVLALQTQMSKASSSSQSDGTVRRMTSQSSSQAYSDADREYNMLLQEHVIEGLAEVSELDVTEAANIDNHSFPSNDDLENNNEGSDSLGEGPISSVLPILTPFIDPSGEQRNGEVPTTGDAPGNLPVFLDSVMNSCILSEKTVQANSSESQSGVTSQEKSSESLKEGKYREKLSESEAGFDSQVTSQHGDKTVDTGVGNSTPSKETVNRNLPTELKLSPSKYHFTDSGPKTLPAVLPSSKRINLGEDHKAPMSMFVEEETLLSDELFASGPGSASNENNSSILTPEIVEYSPVQSSSSELSYNRILIDPEHRFKPFKPNEGHQFVTTVLPDMTKRESEELDDNFHPANVTPRKHNPKPSMKLDISTYNSQKQKMKKNRLSNPEFPVATPITPHKFSTPQDEARNPPFSAIPRDDSSGLGLSEQAFGSSHQFHFPSSHSRQDSSYHSDHMTSPKSRSQLDENDLKIQFYMDQMSATSEDSFIVHDVEDPGLEINLYNAESYEESLSYVFNQYIPQEQVSGPSKGLKVQIDVAGREVIEYRLMSEYYKESWKNIIERDISSYIHNKGISVFTLYTKDTALELHNSPSDFGKMDTLFLIAKEGQDKTVQHPWYCEYGVCKNSGGIPI